MRRGTRRVAMLVPGLLAGSVLLAPEPQARPSPVAELAAAPAEIGYRLGYTSTERPTLRGGVPGQPARAILGEAQRGLADLDPDARGGVLVWVSQRAATGESDLDGDVYLQRGTGAPVRLTNDPGIERQPAVSPDGGRVAFVSDRGGSDDIWLVNADGTGLRRLTDHPGEDTWPTWSPDGTRIAFSSTRDDPDGDIYVIAAAGGALTRLTTDEAADTEPAWSPDGTRIAFTTARFAPADGAAPTTQVVTMPVGGGAATLAVPGPGDSAEPAWAPDGRRIAFTSTRVDNAGDIYLLDGATVTPVATSGLAERHPTWRGNELVYAATDASWPSDVWTADTNGQDRRNRTARPGLAETGPAFSPDGTKLAYSAAQPGGGARIVVADADGRNPRTLAPPGTLATDADTDPAWSPDGNSIAFTRDPADGDSTVPDPRARILVVAATDARLLGEIPMPAHLAGNDGKATWSPTGDQLAITRDATLRRSILGWPVIDRPAQPGMEITAPQTVQTPAVPPKPDVVFLVDDTSSMSYPGEGGASVIGQLRARLPEVINNVRSEQAEAQFGLATFSGEGDDRYLYHPRQALTANDAEIQRAVNGLTADSIYGTENWFYALRQLARNDRIGFRDDSSKIVVLISDTYSMDKRTPDGVDITRESLRDELVGAGISVIGVAVTGTSGEVGLDNDPDGSRTASYLARETGGRLTPDSRPDQMIQAITEAIREVQVTVDPVIEEPCDDGLTITFDPVRARVPAGETAKFEEHVTVSPDVAPGTVLRCTIRFDVNQPQPGLESRQQLVVRVGDPAGPFVRVDDVTLPADARQGSPVTYRPRATDAAGRPLATRCTPDSGGTFAVGQTIVTCTATDQQGRTGQDVATITVVDTEIPSGARIWLVKVASATVDQLTFSDQHDFSIRTAEPCLTRRSDDGAAWSPDGKSIAFADSGSRARLCVANLDGSAPRVPLSADDQGDRWAADPAWAPDGSRIAVALNASEAGTSIVTLPSAGGPATTVVRDAGYEPTYQTLPIPDLSLSVSVGGQPGYVGGDSIPVAFTARNASRLPVTNTWLSLNLPPGLLPVATIDGRCDAATAVCQVGALGVGDQVVINLVLPARAATLAAVSGRLTATTAAGKAETRLAQAPIQVLAPAVVVTPTIGPPGFVTEAVGSNFPPGAVVRLNWSFGITATPDRVTVAPDGTFRTQVLIMRKEPLGPRDLVATLVTGTNFGTVQTPQPFLVVPRSLAPPNFDSGR
ncbi:VWA domain-containing protein [Micromonospora sp. NPDC049559]|uniref:VWA domain-containing protein n=1 Tax=Micromonospora sp. NPDC049559 TaxID=3155923 RepID=UPI00341ED293